MASTIFLAELGFFHQRLLGGFLALADQLALELQPRAFFVHRAAVDAHVENAAFLVDAVVVNDVELGLGERRRDLVLDDLDADVIAVALPAASLSVSLRRMSRRTLA